MSQRCAATSSRTGLPCRRWAIEGGRTCPAHGSSTANAKAAAKRRREDRAAAAAVATLGLALDVTPQEALVHEVKWAAGHVAWLRDKVAELDPEALAWGTTKVKVGGDDAGITSEAKPSVWYELYARERAHMVTVCAAAIRAGVEEREVRLAEKQGDVVIALIRDILDGLYRALLAAGVADSALRQTWTSAVSEVVPRQVRALAGGPR